MTDSDLRRLLDDAVSDVHPEGGPEDIRARARRPSAMRWLPITVAAAAATAVVIAGGAWLAQRGPNSDAPAAAAGNDDRSASQAPAGHPVDATVYYVGATAAGPRLYPEARHVTDATDSKVQVAVDEALTGTPKDPDYESAWPLPGTTAKVTTDSTLITVDLTLPSTQVDLEKGAGERALQALVWTADAAVGKDLPVQFTVDGQPGNLLDVDATAPIEKASADSVLATVLIEAPAQGATVPTQFTVTGRAATFEANVVWELKRGDATVRNGFTTAQECCTLAPYSFTVNAPPGDYTLVVHDTDESDGEGIGTSEDTKDITVE
ncbi:Gmad2 immunoglobulin-like domain-containing protein [Marmoricola sp. URHB0036]|uniref:Gmad2 immunoglobulin-like domain-containing protein n=1 Tax=Marmoricola sp. URHB0036 TaxID=1298863 RepID=UPI000426151C|nr:Gmad2 immunoglobulin-like domain-containing protein [Marmoricola sp. URHB0036]